MRNSLPKRTCRIGGAAACAGMSLFLLALSGCFDPSLGSTEQSTAVPRMYPDSEPSGSRVSVFVSILPQVLLVQRIGGEAVQVEALVPPGANHETYSPSAKQIMRLGQAALYFRIGFPFEDGLVHKIQSGAPRLRVVDTSEGIVLRDIEAHSHGTEQEPASHAHDPHDNHAHSLKDPHIWMAPVLLKVQAEHIANALCEVDPGRAGAYKAGLAQLLEDIGETHRRISDLLAPYAGQAIYVFHPAFGYFTDAYGLEQRAIEVEGKTPTARQLQQVIEEARLNKAKVIFVQSQFDQRPAEIVAESVGARVVPVDPLAEDLLANIESIARQVAEALGSPAVLTSGDLHSVQ